MAKIGTAHIEIKPVLNDDALADVVQRIEDAVAASVERGMLRRASTYVWPNFVTTAPGTTVTYNDPTAGCSCRQENGGSGVCGCTLGGPQIIS